MNLKQAQQEAIKLGGKVEFDLVSRVGRGRCRWDDADFGVFTILTRNGREIEPQAYMASDAIWDDGFRVENQKRVDAPQKQEPIAITGLKFDSPPGSSLCRIYLEIDGKWVEVALLWPSAGVTIHHIIEPLGIRQCILTGKPHAVHRELKC